jgi:hypothetical protein
VRRLKDVIAEITAENLGLKKGSRTRGLRKAAGGAAKQVHAGVQQAKRRSGWPARRTLSALGISRRSYYRRMKEEAWARALPAEPVQPSEASPAERAAVDAGTPVVVPLVNTLNEVTGSHAARLAAARDRLPPSIELLFFVAAVLTMVLMGLQQGKSGEWHLGAMVGFVALVSMVVGVTLDLDQPQRGWIRVSQEPMQRLLSGMAK